MAMQKRQVDRRVARTRATLQQALVALILKKGYDAITVEDICEEANIGRSTFYSHFTSKDDLHRNGIDRLRQQLADRRNASATAQGQGAGPRLGFSLPMLEHARQHIDHYRAMVGRRSGAGMIAHVRKIVSDMVREEVAAPGGKYAEEGVPRELVVQYVVGAYMAVLIWWLDGGAKLPPERVDAMFQDLVTKGILSPQS